MRITTIAAVHMRYALDPSQAQDDAIARRGSLKLAHYLRSYVLAFALPGDTIQL